MSNMIPFVSSSPPPFDDSFGWDDGDDDFGNFTGADDHHEASPDLHITSKTQNNDLVNENVAEPAHQKIAHTSNDNSVDDGDHSTLDTNLNVDSKNAANYNNGDSEFADFAQFDGKDMEVSTPVRPHIVGLPLDRTGVIGESTEPQYIENDSELQVSSESETLQESKNHNKTTNMSMRDSTTDSGMFSNDISPVPKSEDTAEFCDKTSSSDCDEPFPELPSDGRADLTSDQVQHGDNQMACSECVDVGDTSVKHTKVEKDQVGNNTRTNSSCTGVLSSVPCNKKVKTEDDCYENKKCYSSDSVESHTSEQALDEWGNFSDSESNNHRISSVDSERKLDIGDNSIVVTRNEPGVDTTDSSTDNHILSEDDHIVEDISSESKPVANSKEEAKILSNTDLTDEDTSSESKPIACSEDTVEILSDVDHTDENSSSESKPDPNSEDVLSDVGHSDGSFPSDFKPISDSEDTSEHVSDISLHSIKTYSKDHQDSTEGRAIPSNTNLCDNKYVVDSDLESPYDSDSESHTFFPSPLLSSDISVHSIDPESSCSNQDICVSVISSNCTVESIDCESIDCEKDIPHSSDENVFEKVSWHSCEIGLEVDDNSFGNFAKFDDASKHDTDGVPKDHDAVASKHDGDVAPIGDADVTPIDDDVAPINDSDVAPIDDAGVAHIDDADVAPIDDADVSPIDDADVSPIDDADVTSIDDADVTPIDNADVAPIDDDVAPINDFDVAPIDDADVAPIDDADVAPIDDADVTSIDDADVTPIYNADVAPIDDGDNTTKDDDVAPINDDGVAPIDDADVTPIDDADVAPINDPDVAPVDDTDVAPIDDADVASKHDGDDTSTTKHDGDDTTKHDGDDTTKHDGDDTTKDDSNVAPIYDVDAHADDCNDVDDNWASFQSTDLAQNTVDDQPLDLPCISQEDDDDFGDFIDNVVVKEGDIGHCQQFGDSSVVDSNPESIETFSGKGDGDEEWAHFEEHDDDGDGGEFGGFGQFESKAIPEPKTAVTKTVQLKDMIEKVPSVLSSSFPTPVQEDCEVTCKKPAILDITLSCDVEKKVTPQSDRKPAVDDFSKKIWSQLVDLDKTPALVYTWNSSSGTTYMFKTLRIDTQNILLGHKKQSVPIFASNMGLLEPIRGPVDTKKESTKTEPTLVDPNKVDIPVNDNTDIPPVEFDWHNSGLTNPLAAKTLDLDFLTEQESESAGKGSVFQSEMLDAPRSSVKSLPPLEDVLKNMKLTTTTKKKKEENLNPEARRIIDSLPILSFMQAKVLMFPFRQQDQ